MQGETGVAKQTASCPTVVHCVRASLQSLWHQESLLWERCCLPHCIPPRLPRTVPAAPRSGSQPVGIPSLLLSLSCCSDLIPSVSGVPSSCSDFPAHLPSCQPQDDEPLLSRYFMVGLLFRRGCGGQTNTPNVPGKTGKRRGRPPKRKKLLEENLLRYGKGVPAIDVKRIYICIGKYNVFLGFPQ